MGHSERFFYCDKEKDTKRFLEILEKYRTDGDCYKIVETVKFKRNYIVKHKEVKGIQVGKYQIPFNFPTILEIENADHFYRENEEYPDDLQDEKISVYYGEEQEHFFNKNETLIWIVGNRGNMADAYNLFGLDVIATNVLLAMKQDGEAPDDWLIDGKIDIKRLLPETKRAVAQTFFTEEEFQIIEKVKFIDLDGIPDVDTKLWDGTLFKHKEYKAA